MVTFKLLTLTIGAIPLTNKRMRGFAIHVLQKKETYITILIAISLLRAVQVYTALMYSEPEVYSPIQLSAIGERLFLLGQDGSRDESWAYRGRLIHHLSTIIHPVQTVIEGDPGGFFKCQYGALLVSITLLLKGVDYRAIPLLGIVSMAIYLICITLSNCRARPRLAYIYGLFACLIFTTYNADAVALSPGFNFFRYLPLIFILHRIRSGWKSLNGGAFLALSIGVIFNSAQLNLAIIGIVSARIAICIAERNNNSVRNGLLLLIVTSVVTAIQFIVLHDAFTLFPVSSFASVKPHYGVFEYLYTATIIGSLVFAIYTTCSANSNNINDKIAMELVAICVAASYAMSFPLSPAHFSGWLIMSASSFISTFQNIRQRSAALLISILIATAFAFKLIDFSGYNITKENKLYGYKIVGRTVKITSPIREAYLTSRFIDVCPTGTKCLLLSRDKPAIELLLGYNIGPDIYDIYTNIPADNTYDLASYPLNIPDGKIIIDNPERLHKYLDAVHESRIDPAEAHKNEEIIASLILLSQLLDSRRTKCNEAYCLYETGQDPARSGRAKKAP